MLPRGRNQLIPGMLWPNLSALCCLSAWLLVARSGFQNSSPGLSSPLFLEVLNKTAHPVTWKHSHLFVQLAICSFPDCDQALSVYFPSHLMGIFPKDVWNQTVRRKVSCCAYDRTGQTESHSPSASSSPLLLIFLALLSPLHLSPPIKDAFSHSHCVSLLSAAWYSSKGHSSCQPDWDKKEKKVSSNENRGETWEQYACLTSSYISYLSLSFLSEPYADLLSRWGRSLGWMQFQNCSLSFNFGELTSSFVSLSCMKPVLTITNQLPRPT